MNDLRGNNMLAGIKVDIWDEPDGGGFWLRAMDQYIETYAHTYYRLR